MNVIKKVLAMLVLLWLLLLPVFGSGGDSGNGLYEAVVKGDMPTVQKLLLKSPKLVNIRNDAGFTPLHLAALNKQEETVKLLIAKGADVNMKSKCRQEATPLHFAVSGGNLEIVKLLVEKGAKVDGREIDGEPPLCYAAFHGRMEIVKFLLGKGAAINVEGLSERGSSPLNYAVSRGQTETAAFLISKGANLSEKTGNGFTLLHAAASRGTKELFQLLIEKGAEVNAKTDFGWTPIHFASVRGNLEGASILVKKGAKLDLKDNEGRTPLFLAADRGHEELVSLLLNAGADTSLKEKNYGRTPPHSTAIKGYGKIAKLLLSKGSDPNAADDRGKTPIYYAAKYGNKTTAKLLKMKGAKVGDLEKNFGESPLLSKKLEKGEAITWYLGHSGWAIKTQNHFLVFDYFKQEKGPDEPILANGNINPEEIKDLDVTVLVSHAHGDHYSPTIFDWKKDVKKIDFIMGFKPKEVEGYKYMAPREKKQTGDMEILAIKSNDGGVAFFVTVDGIKIFHSGDHANRKQDFSGPFAKEIDYLAENNLKPDFFFAPISGCGFGDLEAVKKGVYYTVKKLSPKVVFPMHAIQNECRYNAFAKEAEDTKLPADMCCAENRGDRFIYKEKKMI